MDGVYNVDIKPMITVREITEQKYKQEETNIWEYFLLGAGPWVSQELKSTEVGEKSGDTKILRLFTIFQEPLSPLENIYHSLDEFFWVYQNNAGIYFVT